MIKEEKKSFLPLIVWILRFLAGGVFIYSGWAKSIDVWGFVFKLEEYAQAAGLSISRPLITVGAASLSVVEFGIGAMLICGCFRRTTAIIYTCFMTAMTALTVWIYLADPVADCGCFGDALIISNGATLLKNIILLTIGILLVRYGKKAGWLCRPRLQWLALACSLAYAIILAVYGFNVQPLYDFRPYKIGTKLDGAVSASEPVFIYEKDGEEHEFTVDNLPDKGEWNFVRRKAMNSDVTDKDAFVIYDADGQEVSLDDIRENDGGLLLLVVPEPRRHGISRIRMANRLYDFINERNGDMAALVATSDPDAWALAVHARYPVFSVEDTDLKELARGEASLVYLSNDTIRWKCNMDALDPDIVDNVPDTEDPLASPPLFDGSALLLVISIIYVLTMIVVLALSHIIRKKNSDISEKSSKFAV